MSNIYTRTRTRAGSDLSDTSKYIESDDEKPKKKRIKYDEFNDKCAVYNLPDYLEIDNKYTKIYDNVKKELINKQINLESIIMMNNILESERLGLIEKYSLMTNSEDDFNLYIKHRNELADNIHYYLNTNMEERKINMEKRKNLDLININTTELENKILNMSNSNYVQGLIYQKYRKLINMSPADSEYYKLKEWIDTSVQIPHNIYKTPIKKDNLSAKLVEIKTYLDKELYGMDKVKEELLMAINQRFTNPSKSDTNIALVGSPGVGKTQIIKVLATIMNYPWEHISLGGTNDSSFLAGHLYTYEGAKPGKIVDSLIKMKCNDGILFFDEIDKIAGKEVSNQLLHITDFTQNDHYCDKYMPEIPIDLSKIWFIFSLNSINDIDPILSNRLNFIHVDGYTIEDKVNICKKHLLPNAFEKYKLSTDKYIFSDYILRSIIIYSIRKENELNSTDKNIKMSNDIKSGIRELKRTIDHIFNRLSLLENMSKSKDTKVNYLLENLSFCPDNIKNLDKLKITEELINKFLL